MPELLRGGCLCGGVRFEIEPPTRFCAHCHCSLCRRAHGAPLVTWAGVPLAQFRITHGKELLGSYASSPRAKRSFCKGCGSSLLFESSRWPNEIHVAVANIDTPLDRPVSAHVFFDDRADWFALDAPLARYGGTTGVESLD
jgi:hypothetical protein